MNGLDAKLVQILHVSVESIDCIEVSSSTREVKLSSLLCLRDK